MEEFLELKKDNGDFKTEEDRDALEHELIAVGIFGLQDPLRNTIVGSII